MFFSYPKTIIVRHIRENLKKCSLTGLEARDDLRFMLYPDCMQQIPDEFDQDKYFILDFEGPVASPQDALSGCVLLDGTWRYAAKMKENIPWLKSLPARSLPASIQTAYPRKQTNCALPDRGLASVEALYMVYLLIGRNANGLLDHYHWKDIFLKLNKQHIDFK